MGRGYQFDEIFIAHGIGCQKNEMMIVFSFRTRALVIHVFGNICLNTDNRFDAGLFCFLIEFYGTIEHPVIRDRHRVHTQLFCSRHEIVYLRKAVQERIVSVGVKMGESHYAILQENSKKKKLFTLLCMVINEQAFADIYDQFAPKIFKFCYFRVSSREEAEDIASQVFIKAWDHIASGNPVTNVQGFLYRIASNLVIDFYRKNKDKREVSLDNPLHPLDVPDKSDFVERIDRDILVQEIQAKLGELPENYREVVILKYVQDISIKEIAEILKTSENNISVRLHRAIEKLKKLV